MSNWNSVWRNQEKNPTSAKFLKNGLPKEKCAGFLRGRRLLKNYISQGYGSTYFALWNYQGRWHNGIDIVAKYDAPVLSASTGRVIVTGDQDRYCYKRGFEKFVAVETATGFVVFYAHLVEIKTETGSVVKRGDLIETVGTTGLETAPHLHFSIFDADGFTIKNRNGCGPAPDGKDLNPVDYLKKLQ